MIDHRWLPPRDALTLGRRTPIRTPDERWRDEERKAPRRTPAQDR